MKYDFGNFYGHVMNQDDMIKAMEDSVEKLATIDISDIYFHDLNRNTVGSQGSLKTFFILFNGRCTSNTRLQYSDTPIPDSLFGLPTSFLDEQRGRLIQPSGKGYVITDPKTGLAIAEIVERTLFILFPLHLSDEAQSNVQRHAQRTLLARIVSAATALITFELPTLRTGLANKIIVPESLLSIKAACSQQATKRCEQAITRLDSLNRTLTAMQTGAIADQYLETLTQLSLVPEIAQIEVADNTLVITTHLMYATDSTGTTREWGAFKITFQFGKQASVKFLNQTRQVNFHGRTYGHAHVQRESNNRWCQGEAADIDLLLEKYDVVTAVLYALKAIDSLNESGFGDYTDIFSRFPTVEQRMQYPTTACPISDFTKRAFITLMEGARNNHARTLHHERKTLVEQLTVDVATITQSSWLHLLHKLTIEDLSKQVAKALSDLQKRPWVVSADQIDDTIIVIMQPINVIDVAGAYSGQTSELWLEIPFAQTGAVKISSAVAEEMGQVPLWRLCKNETGALPFASTSAAVAHLIGSFELASAVTLIRQSLSRYDSRL